MVSDTVFSVAGDLAPVRDLHRVARAHGALLVLDEAHAFGVLGPGGRGAAAAAGIAADPHVIRTFTLSKSLGSQGGAVAGPAEVIGTLIDAGRAFIFDTGLAPPSAAAALAALAILRTGPELGQQARDNARRLAELAGPGFRDQSPAAAVVRWCWARRPQRPGPGTSALLKGSRGVLPAAVGHRPVRPACG